VGHHFAGSATWFERFLRDDVPIAYSVHLKPNLQAFIGDTLDEIPNIRLFAPLDYAYILLTGSGEIQKEGPSLGKPVLMMREVSERPEAIAAGTACLTGTVTQPRASFRFRGTANSCRA